MNNQQAINLLKGLEQSLDDYCELNDEGKTAFGMAITALELFGNSERLPSAQPGWIPCSERLPEEETDVLVCNANGDIQISRGSYSTEMRDYFIWYTTGWRFEKVIAWMPLPEAYQEEA